MSKIFFLAYSLFFIPSLTACSSLMYYPAQNVKFYDPKQVDLQEEDVWVEYEPGKKVHAWWFSAKKQPALGTIVFFHGNAQNLTSHFANLAWIPSEGYNYIIFDYPGYGVSLGSPNPESCVKSGKAVIEWTYKNKDARALIVLGQSIGGITAMRAVEEAKDQIPIKALVLDSTFSSYQSISRKKIASVWITWILQPLVYVLISDRWAPNVEKLQPIPLLISHGQSDFVVEPEFSDEIFRRAGEPKTYWKIENGYHSDMFFGHDRVYRKKFLDWLAALK